MKKTIFEVREQIRALLKEVACPGCGNPDAYIGMNDVKCPNPDCKFYEDCPACGGQTQSGYCSACTDPPESEEGEEDRPTFDYTWFAVQQKFPKAAEQWLDTSDTAERDEYWTDEVGLLHARPLGSPSPPWSDEHVWDPDGGNWMPLSRR